MRSIIYEHYGEPSDVLQYQDMPDLPAPGISEVLIRVRSRPILPGDLLGVRGRYRAPGNTADVAPGGARPGFEGVGVIEALGPGVSASTGLTPGRRVAFFPARWAWSDYVLAQSQFVTPVPDQISDAVAGQLHVNPLTASLLQRATKEAGVHGGDLVVLTAAGSSVAKLAMTLALRSGLSVIGTVRSKSGAVSLQSSFPGAAIVTTDDPDWRDRILAAGKGKPIRAILDPVGGSLASDLISILADGGFFIGYGELSGQPISIPALAFPARGLTMRGVSVGRWSGLPEAVRTADIRTAIDLASNSVGLFSVAAEYDLSQIANAISHAEQAGRTGAVMLTSLNNY